MTGDEIVEGALAHVRKWARGGDEAWLRGYALGQIEIAMNFLQANHDRAFDAQLEIERLTRPIRSE